MENQTPTTLPSEQIRPSTKRTQQTFLSPQISKLISAGLAVTIFALLVASGYFAYQYLSLKKQLSIQEKPTKIQFDQLTLEELERLIDENQNAWKQYRDQTLSFKYPLYLPQPRDLSADTDLAAEDEKISSYLRSSEGRSAGGRSYWVILKEPQPNTKGADVKEWIEANKINTVFDNSGETITFPIEETIIDGKEACLVNYIYEEDLPITSFVYFQTKQGISGVGYHSWQVGEGLIKNYNIYKKILITISIDPEI